MIVLHLHTTGKLKWVPHPVAFYWDSGVNRNKFMMTEKAFTV